MSPDASVTTRRSVRWAAAWLLALAAGACLVGSGDLLQERREQVRRMTPSEQARLRENLRRFVRLDAGTRERLQRIHDELDRDPNAAELRQVMRRYCAWLASQPMTTQYELTDLPAERRLARIKELLDEEQDERGVEEWLKIYVPRMIGRLPRERIDRIRETPESGRRPEAIRALAETLRTTDGRSEPLDKALADLRGRISPATRKRLEKQPPEKQLEWVGSQRGERFFRRMLAHFLGPPPAVTDQELAETFNEQPAEVRDLLLGLPSEKMYDKLRELYHGKRMRGRPGGGPPGPGGGPPGPREGRWGPPDAQPRPPDSRQGPPDFSRGPQPGPQPSPPRNDGSQPPRRP